MKKLLLVISILLLFAAEISRVYFIMPFPGSQKGENIGYAYWIHTNLFWIRLVLLSIVLIYFIPAFRKSNRFVKIILVIVAILYGIVFYLFNFKWQADKMFLQPSQLVFKDVSTNTVNNDKLVLGVVLNGEARAYPIQLIGYHHQVRDSLGNVPLMITYCTVCRTGRIFSPEVKGKNEEFRLVGMDHFNAMFEDKTTKTWWRQATGEAVAGKLKGYSLKEIPSTQLTLEQWLKHYPQSLIMQPDTSFNKRYEHLAEFDRGTIKSGLEARDSIAWKPKSWVVGVEYNNHSKAYDWNMLVDKQLLQDSLPELPLVVTLEKDTASYNVLQRMVNGRSLYFQKDSIPYFMRDTNTLSLWSYSGICVEGELKGEKLKRVQAYQEFWHSWSTFHPATEKFEY